MFSNSVIVTGGLGYIGSHIVVDLYENGYFPIIVDSCVNSDIQTYNMLAKIIPSEKFLFFKRDIRDVHGLRSIFSNYLPQSVIHLAANKSVPESVEKPTLYYDNNVGGTLALLRVCNEFSVQNFVFSSSCTVYGDQNKSPLSEEDPLGFTNPYGHTKILGEQAVELLMANDNSKFSILRYFNPVGVHPSGHLREKSGVKAANLFPIICNVVSGDLERLSVFGDDHPTRDGSAIRDYIHIQDLSSGHVKALKYLQDGGPSHHVNLGTGRGHSVLEVVAEFSRQLNWELPYKITGRREGDVSIAYANPAKALDLFGWRAVKTLTDMVSSSLIELR